MTKMVAHIFDGGIMDSNTYRSLESIFSKFNESVVELYSSLIELYPPNERDHLLHVLGMTLKNTAEMHRYVQDTLFQANTSNK
jgi:hypothetical protein